MIDLVFTDLIMPGGMSGTELFEEVRQIQPEMKVMFTSGYSNQDVGMPKDVPLLAKPYKLKDLAAKVDELFDTC